MTNYLPFDLEKALKGEPYAVLSKDGSEFHKADFPPHQLPAWHDWSFLIKASNTTWLFDSDGRDDLNFHLVMLPPEPKVEYRYANEYVDHVVGCHDAIEMCNSRNGFNRIGIIRYTYHDGRLMPELTVRIEDYSHR